MEHGHTDIDGPIRVSVWYPWTAASRLIAKASSTGTLTGQEAFVEPRKVAHRVGVVLVGRGRRADPPRWIRIDAGIGRGKLAHDLGVRLERAVMAHQAEEALVARLGAGWPIPQLRDVVGETP